MKRSRFRWILLRRALLERKTKTVLMILATAMGASVLTALLNLEVDLRARMNRQLRDYGPNVILLPDASSRTTYLNESVLSLLRADNILAYTPELIIPAAAHDIQTAVIGADLTSLKRLYPGWQFRISSADSKACLMGVRLAKKLNVQPGDSTTIRVAGRDVLMKIGGLIEGGEAEDDQIFADLAFAQGISKNEGRFHIVAVSVLGEIADVERQFDGLVKSQPGVAFQLIRKIAAAESLMLDKIAHLMSLVLVIIFVTLFFCIHTTVSAVLLARQAEIALFRVLGARRKQIMTELILELVVIGLAGGLMGYIIGVFMAQVLGKILFQTYVYPRWNILFVTMFSSFIMMVISSFLPIRRAINRQAALVLKEA